MARFSRSAPKVTCNYYFSLKLIFLCSIYPNSSSHPSMLSLRRRRRRRRHRRLRFPPPNPSFEIDIRFRPRHLGRTPLRM